MWKSLKPISYVMPIFRFFCEILCDLKKNPKIYVLSEMIFEYFLERKWGGLCLLAMPVPSLSTAMIRYLLSNILNMFLTPKGFQGNLGV